MLSISQPMKGCGKGDYYLNLAREDYYLNGGEPQGKWYGEGAERLGLSGQISPAQFRNLLAGYTPDGKEALVQNAGDPERRSGWDLTWSAPKSVSAYWAVSDPETRRVIQEEFESSVHTGLRYLEENAAWTRRGKEGSERERSKMVWTTFEHSTSRAQEPQLHIHSIGHNVSIREDGTTGTIDSAPLYEHKMTAGAVQRADLAARLERRLGLQVERDRDSFRVVGVPEALCDEWSTRRKEIEAALDERGFTGAKASAIAALDTREKKEEASRAELFTKWEAEGRALGFGPEEARALSGKRPKIRSEAEVARATREATEYAVSELTKRQSHFTAREMIRHAAVFAQGRGLTGEQAIAAVRGEIGAGRELVLVGERRGERHYTTKEMLALEKKMLSQVSLTKDRALIVSKENLEPALSSRTLTDEQKNAVSHITRESGAVKVVSGMAGTGKSYMLGAAREAWEKEGFTVIGAALAGKAAKGLEEGSGIKSETLHRTLGQVEKGYLKFDRKTVLVIDEAGMVGTRQMANVIDVATGAGTKVVLVGDARQLQAIEAGGAFKAIEERIGSAKLTEIKRQEETWARDAVHDFADGRGKRALEEYTKRGLVSIEPDAKRAKEKLVSDWSREGIKAPEKNLILASQNHDVRELNSNAQSARLRAGALGPKSIAHENRIFHEKDRILFTRNSRVYDVSNGQLGTVTKIEKGRVTATLDDGKAVTVPKDYLRYTKLGYAVTTHAAQGISVNKAYVLMGGTMQDREQSYVQMSRAKEKARIYVDAAQAGHELAELAKSVQRSHQKDLASDVRPSLGLSVTPRR